MESQMPKLEDILHEVKIEVEISKEDTNQFHSYEDDVCKQTILTDGCKLTAKGTNGTEILYPFLTSDNPFGNLGKQFLANIASHPLLIQLGCKHSGSIFKKYANQCDFYLVMIPNSHAKSPITDLVGPFNIYVKQPKYQDVLIGRSSSGNFNSLKESIYKRLIFQLSKICKVIITKEFTEISCKRVLLVNRNNETIENVSISENKDMPSNGNHTSINEVKWEIKLEVEKIKPSLVSCKTGTSIDSLDLCLIQDVLKEFFNNYVQNDDCDDLIFMPEIGSTTQNTIKGFIAKLFKPWLDAISINYDQQDFLVIRKIIPMQKLATILELSDGENGSYKLLLPGKLTVDNFEGELIESDVQWVTHEESSDLLSYDDAPTDTPRRKITVDNVNMDISSVSDSTVLMDNASASSFRLHMPVDPLSDVIYFPPTITEDKRIKLPARFQPLCFLQKYSIVIEDRVHSQYRPILMSFAEAYNIFFCYTMSNAPAGETESGNGTVEWIATVTLQWLDKAFELAIGSGSTKKDAINEASKNALVILSGICNIIIRKTCREKRSRQFNNYIDVNIPDILLPDGDTFSVSSSENFYMDPMESYNSTKPAKTKITKCKSLLTSEFHKLTGILNKFVSGEYSLDDLIFLEEGSPHKKSFFCQIVKQVYHETLKLIEFEKNDQKYLSVMKIIHPKFLTNKLIECRGEKGPYMLYSPGTLDIGFLWNRTEDYISDGKILTYMFKDQYKVPDIHKLKRGHPRLEPACQSKITFQKKAKKTLKDIVRLIDNGEERTFQPPSKRRKTDY